MRLKVGTVLYWMPADNLIKEPKGDQNEAKRVEFSFFELATELQITR